jgi:rubredoxin
LESKEKSFSLETLNKPLNTIVEKAPAQVVYQCKNCFSIYDEAFGDIENNIIAGTSFSDLSKTYRCPLCEAAKEDFVEVDFESLQLQNN